MTSLLVVVPAKSRLSRHSASLRAFTPVFDGLWTRLRRSAGTTRTAIGLCPRGSTHLTLCDEWARYRTVLRSSTVLSNTRLMVQIQRLPANASGYRQ
jgi:hypothetical protein